MTTSNILPSASSPLPSFRKPKLLVIQPYLTSYRIPVFEELANEWDVVIVSSSPATNAGYAKLEPMRSRIKAHYIVCQLELINGFFTWQRGLLQIFREVKPEAVFFSASPRALSSILLALVARFFSVKVYGHGQGLYRKPNPRYVSIALYKFLILISHRYICYCKLSYDSLLPYVKADKIAIASNSLHLTETVLPSTKKHVNGVLFIGRLRESNEIPKLVIAMKALRKEDSTWKLHIIGTGTEEPILRSKFKLDDWIIWHGSIYDESKIKEISLQCSIGCYPGNAGLSVVQYMALSLVPVVHDKLNLHMGPEPSYIKDGVNGRTFRHDLGAAALSEVLISLSRSDEGLRHLAKEAFATYQQLANPSLARRIQLAIDYPIAEGQ